MVQSLAQSIAANIFETFRDEEAAFPREVEAGEGSVEVGLARLQRHTAASSASVARKTAARSTAAHVPTVPTDAFVDVETVRYSVPHRLVRRTVEVLLGDDEVVIFDGVEVVARHRRVREPFTRVVEHGHFAGLMRPHDDVASVTPLSPAHGRTLADYAAVVAGAA
jgi:hypothetical protein